MCGGQNDRQHDYGTPWLCPLSWQRIVRTRAAADPSAPPRVDICYVTPCKRRLRTFPEIQRYLDTNGIPELTIDHFTFSKKVNIGIVIDERNMTEAPPESFPVSKRRGRPPKHARLLQFMESKAQKRCHPRRH